jgi:hypothetical protein
VSGKDNRCNLCFSKKIGFFRLIKSSDKFMANRIYLINLIGPFLMLLIKNDYYALIDAFVILITDIATSFVIKIRKQGKLKVYV